MHQSCPASRARVVIVGAGFGGLAAVKTLRDAPVEVLLLDRHNYDQVSGRRATCWPPRRSSRRGVSLQEPRDHGHVGRNEAIAEIGPFRFTGSAAWLVWLFVHLALLIGFRNRVVALLDRAIDHLFHDRPIRLIARPPARARDQAQAEPGRGQRDGARNEATAEVEQR